MAVGFALWVAISCVGFAQEAEVTSERPPGAGPTLVEVNFYVIDLMKVIDTDEAFEADIFIRLRWSDPRLVGERVRVVPTADVWAPHVLVFNRRDVSSTLPDEVVIHPDGTVIRDQRLIGTFAASLDLSRFPMDSQTLKVQLVNYGAAVDEVVLVEAPTLAASRSPEFAITDWEIGDLEVDSKDFSPVPTMTLSSITLSVGAHRLLGYYVVQMLIPLLLILAMSWAVFWIEPSVIPTRMSVCVTTVLTLIAYRFMIGGLVPKLPYLTRVDYLLLGSTVLVAGSLATVVVSTYLTARDRSEAVARIEAVARVVYPSCFALLFGALAVLG